MKNEQQTYTDKAAWGLGPWQNEPDREQFTDEATGFPCLVVRNHGGALCGYVGVPEGHPWHGKDYSHDDINVDVHGGLTFADKCHEGGKICHKVEPGEPDNVWWLGFACAHLGDVSPAYKDHAFQGSSGLGEYYKDLAYVKREIASLATQIKEAGNGAQG